MFGWHSIPFCTGRPPHVKKGNPSHAWLRPFATIPLSPGFASFAPPGPNFGGSAAAAAYAPRKRTRMIRTRTFQVEAPTKRSNDCIG